MKNGFNARKAAQVAAYFCREAGGTIPVLKLVKLIYLSDRESMLRTGFPITNDNFVSMTHGPVNSSTLDLISGNAEAPSWSDLISDRANHMVSLARETNDLDIDELSELDVDVLSAVWKTFGGMTKWQIRDWTHDNCPEWEDPEGSCQPIPPARILKYLKVEGADEIAAEIAAYRKIDSVFESLRA
jgi:uncharacterized phage-associated protein